MGNLLYFLPGVNSAIPTPLDEATCKWFPHLTGFPSPSYRHISGDGPGGKSGTMIGITSERVGYYPEEQVWHQFHEDLWIGRTQSLIAPKDLQKPKQYRGYAVTSQGHEWIIPCVSVDWATVPKSYGVTVNKDGSMLFAATMDSFTDLAAKAERWFDIMYKDGFYKASEAFFFCVEMLQMNYWLGPFEVGNVLRLVDSETATEIINEASGINTLLRQIESKKNTDEIVPST